MAAYCVTSLGGLERFVRQELKQELCGSGLCLNVSRETFVRQPDESPLAPEWGRTCFEYDGPASDLLSLRSVENVYAAVAQFKGLPANESGLETIRRWVASCDLDEACRVHAQVHGPRDKPSFRCTSRRAGEHAYNSMQIMAAAGAGVVDRYGWRVDLEGYDYDLHVNVDGDRCTVDLRLTPESLHRRGRFVHVPASLNPTLGHALCVLSEPQPGEVFLDPTCGAGTVLLERAALGPARLIAGDLFARPVEVARTNVEANDITAQVLRWDARRLPLAAESVDKVCANLPWGRRAGSHLVNKHLYPALVREIARVLRVGGLAVLLTLERRMLTAILDRHGWLRTVEVLPVVVGGLRPCIYVVRKWRGQERPGPGNRGPGTVD